MTSFPGLLLLLLTCSVCALSGGVQDQPKPAKKYTINLDVEASQRWEQVALDHASYFKSLLSEIIEELPKPIVELVDKIDIKVADLLPYPYGVELAGFAKIANVSEKDALLANMIYELTAYNRSGAAKACTSIITKLTDGKIIHARNFDYDLASSLRKLVIEVEFTDNGKIMYTGTTFAGLVGLPSAQKPNAFTISINERNVGSIWENAFEGLIAGTHGIAHLVVRDLVSNPMYDFKMAVQTLAETPLIATIYAIVGGLDDGVVITHGRPSAVNMWWLGTNNSWFLVETNYDHWKAPPIDDDRRDVAIKLMMDVGASKISMTAIVDDVLSIVPVINTGTIFTNVMSASMPEQYKSWVRDI